MPPIRFIPGFIAALLLSACSSEPRPLPVLATAPFQPDSGSLLVRCGALVDGRSEGVARDVEILVENGCFSRIGPDLAAPADLPLPDLSGHACLPGFIEMHAHMLESFETLTDLTAYNDTLADLLDAGREYSRLAVDAGFTTARNLAAYYAWADRELRDRIDRGEIVGPRMQAAGFYLTVPGGGGDLLEVGGDESRIPGALRKGVSRTVEEFRMGAHELVAGGADVIKIIASGAVLAYGTDVAIYPHGMQAMQFPYMVEWGMTPMEAIQSATSVAARYMGWEDRVGAIQPGLLADLVAVRGDPLADISVLEDVDAVVMGGLVFKGPAGLVRSQ